MKKIKDTVKGRFAAVREFAAGIYRNISEYFAGHDGRGRKFRPTKNFAIYLFLLLFSILFTQILRSSVSAVILIFMIFLPILALLYLLSAVFSIKIYLNSDYTEAEKSTPVDFSLSVSNSSPIPYPFTDAMISVPTDDAVRCTSSLTRLSLIPFGSYEIKKKISFAYRGAYDIGVSDVYVSDPMRLFCYRMDVNLSREIYVYPRRLTLLKREGDEIESEVTDAVSRMSGSDNTEMNDIRSYIPGDSLRSVHWKLSSKTEELQIRQYARNSEKQTIIICDNAARYPEDREKYADDICEFAADGIIETAIALAASALSRSGGTVTLVWFDNRGSEEIYAAHFDSQAAFDEIYRLFSTAPVFRTDKTAGFAASLAIEGIDHAALCFISGCIDSGFAASLSDLHISGGTTAELYTYIPTEKIADGEKKAYFETLETNLGEIARHGIKISDARDGRISDGIGIYDGKGAAV